MLNQNIILPSKPRVVSTDGNKGVYEIDNLYPGYGHTLGNSLRRIILSSLPGAALTTVKIDGVAHEFSTIAGVKEDVIMIILNLKKVRFKITSDEPQMVSLSVKGAKMVTAKDIKVSGQVEVLMKTNSSVSLQRKILKYLSSLLSKKDLDLYQEKFVKKVKWM
jgi:DNA-directed RNA polymerase subunit alpha